jgi:serine/threonine-protein kinase HipA
MANDCFVYMALPGQADFVTCGRFRISERRDGIALGEFVYGRSYLARPDRVELDPVELTFARQSFETVRLKGVFGALRDAGPDYWGRRLIERRSGKPVLEEIDYLLESPDDRSGALGFGLNVEPPAPKRQFNRTIDLVRLQMIADAILKDEPIADPDLKQVEDLMLIGTSMGGARPKTVVEDDEELWVAKFNCDDDRWNNARVEHSMLHLARACGIQSVESRVVQAGGRDVLLVKRFDRARIEGGYARSRMVSALTLLRTEDTFQSRDRWSYLFLVEELRRVSTSAKNDAEELFRRMVFNALISNTDDHPRNHAIIAKERDWRLSPAYDLTPNPVIVQERRDLALIGGDLGRYANAENMLSQSPRFLIEPERATRIVNDIEEKVKALWYETARREGVTEEDCRRIAGAFAYPGFRLRAAG